MDPLHQAPRLYLDTAGLCDLGDGKRPGLLDRICGAMNAAGAVLVVGPAHMLDLHRRADAATRERFFALLDQFPRVATVHSSPPISHDRQTLDALLTAGRDKNPGNDPPDLPDLVLEAAMGGVRASFAEGDYSEAEWTTAALEGESLSVETSGFGAGQGEKLPREAQRILEQAFAMATRGEDAAAWMMDQSVHPKLRRHPEVLADEARLRALQQEQGPFLQLLGELVKGVGGTPQRLVPQLTAEQHGIPVWWRSVPSGVSRWLGAARLVAPGSFLKASLLRDKNKDSRRAPKLSDNADEFHVAFIPYMDVFTLDRENLGIMKRYVGSLRAVRRASLIQNGDDDGLVRAIESLAAQAAE